MIKTAEIKKLAFFDELEKLGGPGFLVRAMTKYLPDILRFGRTAEAMKVGKGVTHRAWKYLTNPATKNLATGEFFRKGIAGAAERFGKYKTGILPDFDPSILNQRVQGPATQKWRLHLKSTSQPIEKIKAGTERAYPKFRDSKKEWIKSLPGKWVGEIATNLNTIQSKKNGLWNFVKREVNVGRTFTRDTAEGTFRYKRNALGQVLGPVGTTGVGFGAINFASGGVDPITGKRVPIIKRTARALGEATAWSVAPGLSMATITPGMVKDLGGMAFGKAH